MPIYEVEHNGKVYEVDASSAEQAAEAFSQQPAKQSLGQSIVSSMAGPMAATGGTPDDLASAELNVARAGLSGIHEGYQALKAGAKQLYGGISDAITGEDLAGRGKKAQYTAEEILRKQMADMEANPQPGLQVVRSAAAGAIQYGALALAPELALPRTTTILGALARNFSDAALGSLFEFDPEQDPELAKAAKAGGLGAAIGFVPSIYSGTKNFLARGLQKVAQEGRTEQLVLNASKALPGVTYTLAQRTGVPELSTLERGAYNFDAVNFYADQTDKFIAEAADALRQPLAKSQTLSGDLAAVKEVLDDKINGMRRSASEAWEYGLRRASKMAPADMTVPIDSFKQAIPKALEDLKVYRNTDTNFQVPESFSNHLERILDKKGLSIGELDQTLRELRALQNSKDARVVAIATQLRNSGIEQDLAALEKLPTQEPAIQMLKQTRQEYQRAMTAAEQFENAGLFKMLDGATDSQSAIANFMSYGPEKQASIRQYMQKHTPNVLNSMKQQIVDDAIASTRVQPGSVGAADSQQSLERLSAALFDGGRIRAEGLWSPKEIERIEGIRDGLAVIANSRPKLGSAGTPVKPEDISINLASRSEAFIVRQLTRIVYSKSGAKLFTDPKVYQLLRYYNHSTTGSAMNLAARAGLLAYLQDAYPVQSQQEQQQQ